MDKKVTWLILAGIIIVLIAINIVLFRGDEDNWIKDSNGVWIKHGNPSNTPNDVSTQAEAITCAAGLYNTAKDSGMIFDSQCLGKCSDYSVDIVHVPRSTDDNLVENQCAEYRDGVTHKFIELDSKGVIIRVA